MQKVRACAYVFAAHESGVHVDTVPHPSAAWEQRHSKMTRCGLDWMQHGCI